jgi:hypothetical protein
MASRKSYEIEYRILRVALQRYGEWGYPSSLPQLEAQFREAIPDITDMDLVDAMKRLRPDYLRLWKWSKGHGRFVEYPTDISDDNEFFYRNDFCLQRTPQTQPRAEELHAMLHPAAEVKPRVAGGLTLIAESQLAELRRLVSAEFDFRKLVRLCEELNITAREECIFAAAMLTRTLLDHVPPLFGKKNFEEVASNYGGKSFKGTMQHLQNASRNVADGHLHEQIRKTETLPTPQQVNCGQQLDVLLEEIVRITHEKGKTP